MMNQNYNEHLPSFFSDLIEQLNSFSRARVSNVKEELKNFDGFFSLQETQFDQLGKVKDDPLQAIGVGIFRTVPPIPEEPMIDEDTNSQSQKEIHNQNNSPASQIIEEDNLFQNQSTEVPPQTGLKPMENQEGGSSQSEQSSPEIVQPNSSSNIQKPKRKITKDHLRKFRRSKNHKTSLQLLFQGHWMKNFLQFGKKPHFDWLLEYFPQYFQGIENIQKISDSQELQNVFKVFMLQNLNNRQEIIKRILNYIKNKNGIGLQDYLILYKIKELNQLWEKFFTKKILYRQLMLSRADPKSKVAFVKFLHRFEDAFRTGVFDHIA